MKHEIIAVLLITGRTAISFNNMFLDVTNQSHAITLNQEQADAIETFIQFDGGGRSQLCDEIWSEAKYRIKSNWRDGTHDALNELRTGEQYGPGYGKGQSV